MELSPVIGKEAIPSEGTNLSKKHVIEPIQSLGTARSERLVAYKGEAEVEEIGLPAYLSLCFHLIHISPLQITFMATSDSCSILIDVNL